MDAFVSAMSTVLAGEKSFPTAALVRLLAEQATYQRNVRPSASEATTWLVSPRRREVLQALAEGLTAREVAERMSISPHTVRTHISDILLQFGARSTLQAVLIALQVGLITLPTN
jgi:DNA-binding NarL/FixJ family response regulator